VDVESAYRTSDVFAEPRSHGIDRIQGEPRLLSIIEGPRLT